MPPELAAVVDRALAFRRDDRFPDARAIQAALEEANLALYAEPVLSAAVGPVPADRDPASTKITDESALRETAPYVTDPIIGDTIQAPIRASRASAPTVASETPAEAKVSRETMGTPPPVSPLARPSLEPGAAPTPEAPSKASGGSKAMPIALVVCDDSEEPARVATHLVDGVGVPAILGFARSKEVLDLAESLFIPRGVLALATNTATMLSSIPHALGKPRLVCRTTMSSTMTIAAEVAVLTQLVEPELRAAPGLLAPGEPIRVALVRVDNATGLGSADRYVASIRFNDRSIASGLSFDAKTSRLTGTLRCP